MSLQIQLYTWEERIMKPPTNSKLQKYPGMQKNLPVSENTKMNGTDRIIRA